MRFTVRAAAPALRGMASSKGGRAVSDSPKKFMSQENNGFHVPSPDEIADCAYLIWEKEGRPVGRAREHWLQAETQLMACRAHDNWTGEPSRRQQRVASSN